MQPVSLPFPFLEVAVVTVSVDKQVPRCLLGPFVEKTGGKCAGGPWLSRSRAVAHSVSLFILKQ